MSVPDFPQLPMLDRDALLACVEECFECAVMCTACADASLSVRELRELIPVVRLSLGCAEVCVGTGQFVTRPAAPDFRLVSAALEFCADACRVCAEECERHAASYQHCKVCAEACRRCRTMCERLVAMITEGNGDTERDRAIVLAFTEHGDGVAED